MFRKSIKLFRAVGVDIRIDPSWFFLVALITWSLAMGLFPLRFPGLSPAAWWAMGFAGAIGLFLSILFHEISHSLVGRRFGINMKSITLFLFGGMAEMPDEPRRPKAEFWMAVAGPISSLVLAAVFYGLGRLVLAGGGSLPWFGILGYLALVNVFLAVFNLVPAFPLDGGRVLRSILWASGGDYDSSTRIATGVGAGFGVFLMVIGGLRILTGNPVGGIWWILIGLFIRASAQASLKHLALGRLLSHEPVRDFMNTHPVSVPADLSVHRLVDEFLYRYHHKSFPVTEGDRLVGCVGLPQIRGIDRNAWDGTKVSEVMEACAGESLVSPEQEAEEALRRMNRTESQTLWVTESGRLKGVLSARDLLHHLSLKLELEKRPGEPVPASP